MFINNIGMPDTFCTSGIASNPNGRNGKTILPRAGSYSPTRTKICSFQSPLLLSTELMTIVSKVFGLMSWSVNFLW
jgi:hypothetical protein